MRTSHSLAASILTALLIAFGARAEDAKEFRPLLNGKDLSGWQNAQGKPPAAGWAV